jgi:hypothetical protein
MVTNLKRLITICPSGWAYQIAEVYVYRGEIDKAFDWMDRAYQQRDRGLLVVKSDWLINSPLSVLPTLSTTAHARKTASVVFPVRTFQSTLIAADAFNFFFWRRNRYLSPVRFARCAWVARSASVHQCCGRDFDCRSRLPTRYGLFLPGGLLFIERHDKRYRS